MRAYEFANQRAKFWEYWGNECTLRTKSARLWKPLIDSINQDPQGSISSFLIFFLFFLCFQLYFDS